MKWYVELYEVGETRYVLQSKTFKTEKQAKDWALDNFHYIDENYRIDVISLEGDEVGRLHHHIVVQLIRG